MRTATAHLARNVRRNGWWIVAVLALAILVDSGTSRWDEAQQERAAAAEAARPFTDFVAYSSIRFVAADEAEGVLQMESTYSYFSRVDRIVWSDRLRCQGPTIGDDVPPREWPIWSTQEGTAVRYLPTGVELGELATRPWTFTGEAGRGTDRPPFPVDERTCVMVSAVLIEVDGNTDSTVVESPPFRPGDDG